MEELARIVVVARHRLFRQCLANLLREGTDLEVAAELDGLEAVENWLEEEVADLLLLDLSRPREVELEDLRAVRERCPGIKVVILGLSEEQEDFLRCIEAGARGYVLQESSFDDLKKALRRVLAGEVFCSPRVTYSMFSRLGELAEERRRREQVEALELTPREMEVLELLAEGLSNRQIAERVCLSIYTVKNHVHNILDKMDVGAREQAVEKAFARRWLQEPLRSTG